MPEGSEYAGLILRLSPLELLRAQRWPLDTVLTGSVDQFKGKIVVVGVELPQDRIEVTRGLHREVRYGYELHADAVNNLLQGVSVRPLGTGAQFLLMLIMAALACGIPGCCRAPLREASASSQHDLPFGSIFLDLLGA
jgi:CHASE2 domain-containing sensor protein